MIESIFTTKDNSGDFYGHSTLTITDEDIEKLKAGKELFSSIEGEYSISLIYESDNK